MKTKYETYLTPGEGKLVTAAFIGLAIAFVVGLSLYVAGANVFYKGYENVGRNLQICSASVFCTELLFLFYTLGVLIRGEIELRSTGLSKRQIKQVVNYCYPSMTKKQFRKYYNILRKTIKSKNKTLKELEFKDFDDADKWAQTEELIVLERKWTWQLSKNHGMNIKY